jgi:conjugal transfer pilin signal peptidase TrbI
MDTTVDAAKPPSLQSGTVTHYALAQQPTAPRAARLRAWFATRWPRVRKQLKWDLLLLMWLGVFAHFFAIAWVMTDSVHTSLALVIKGASVRPGELAVFEYRGGQIERYYEGNWLHRAQAWLGGSSSNAGPAVGDGFVKYLMGVPGDRVEVQGDRVYLHTKSGSFDMGRCKPVSRYGAPLQPIQPQVIPAGFVYVWAPHVDALDSRYAVMGLVPSSAISGKAVPLW